MQLVLLKSSWVYDTIPFDRKYEMISSTNPWDAWWWTDENGLKRRLPKSFEWKPACRLQSQLTITKPLTLLSHCPHESRKPAASTRETTHLLSSRSIRVKFAKDYVKSSSESYVNLGVSAMVSPSRFLGVLAEAILWADSISSFCLQCTKINKGSWSIFEGHQLCCVWVHLQ